VGNDEAGDADPPASSHSAGAGVSGSRGWRLGTTLASDASVRLAANRPRLRVQGLSAPAPCYLRLAAGYGRRLLWQMHHGRRDLMSGRVPVWVSDLQTERTLAAG
jgi:hypothetical protein